MYIVIALLGSAVLVRTIAWPVLRTWWHAIPVDPSWSRETLSEQDVYDARFATIVQAEIRRNHPSMRPPS